MTIMITVIIKNLNLRGGCGAAWGTSKGHLCLKNRTPARSDGEAQGGQRGRGPGTAAGKQRRMKKERERHLAGGLQGAHHSSWHG